jgi:hypothetical protein
MHAEPSVAKRGAFLYDGAIECDVRIVCSPVHFGTGDHEDPSDVRDDQDVVTFYVEYGSTSERGVFTAGGGGYPSLTAAVAAAEAALGSAASVKWHDEA